MVKTCKQIFRLNDCLFTTGAETAVRRGGGSVLMMLCTYAKRAQRATARVR